MVSTKQIAVTTGRHQRTVRRICRKLGIALVGRDYLLTPHQATRVEREVMREDRRGPKAGKA